MRGIPTPITGLASRHRRSARLPVARGEVKLTDPVEKYLPAEAPLFFYSVQTCSVVRLREMMRGSAIRNLIEAELAPSAIGNDEASIEQDIRDRAAITGQRHSRVAGRRRLDHAGRT